MITVETAESIATLEKLREDNSVSQYNPFEKYKAVYLSKEDILGRDIKEFGEYFVKIFEEFLSKGNKYILSVEQQELIDKYFSEADGVMSDVVKQLDKYLAEYREEKVDG